MQNLVLNEKPIQVYVILAETLEGWKSPTTDEGKAILMEHYAWASELKKNDKIILAGPMNFDLLEKNKVDKLEGTTGLIMLKAGSREEAEKWAMMDPFHINKFRKNTVHSMKITISDSSVFEVLNSKFS